jgi:hypothetical protein
MKGGVKNGYPNTLAPANAPRNVKNNNPGSLRISDSAWRGKIPVALNTDKAFEQFETMVLGARAHIKNLQTHYNRGAHTLTSLIHIWSPPTENDTDAYIQYVSKQTGIGKDAVLTLSPELLIDLCFAMSEIENARSPFITRQNYVDAFNIL